MKMSKEDFKRLQLEWYQTLSNSGFKDIERVKGDDLVLVQTASYCYRSTDEFSRKMKEDYFRCMSQAVHDENTVFRNKIDRYILVRHSEGAKINAILRELGDRGVSRDRKTVRIIIRRYEMAWGFRTYEPKQLNVRKKA